MIAGLPATPMHRKLVDQQPAPVPLQGVEREE